MIRRTAWALVFAIAAFAAGPAFAAPAQDEKVDTLGDMLKRLKSCWQAPELPSGHPGMQITVLFSLKRDGELLGRPRITFETPGASEADSIAYRTAVMQTLQHCTPMPLSGSLGDAVAGRPFRMRFDDRRNQPKPTERKAWLSPTIL